MSRHIGNWLAMAWLLLAVMPLRGGSFSGRMFNLDGTQIAKERKEEVRITVFQLDKDNRPVQKLFEGRFDDGTFAFAIQESQLLSGATKAIRMNFFRNNLPTRTTDGLLATSDTPRVFDVTVPEEPPSCDHCGTKGACTVRSQSAMIVGKYARVVSPAAALRVGENVLGLLATESVLPVRRVENGWVWTSKMIGQREVKGWIWSGDLEKVDEVVQLQPIDPMKNKGGAVVAGSK
jgi:hypothetical protein